MRGATDRQGLATFRYSATLVTVRPRIADGAQLLPCGPGGARPSGITARTSSALVLQSKPAKLLVAARSGVRVVFKRSFVLMAVAACLCGCATNAEPSASEAPPPSNYRELIVASLRTFLKDPYSVRDAEIAEPRTMFVGLLNGGMAQAVCVRLNAKNSYGAYAGLQTYAFVFKDGRAVVVGHLTYGCREQSYSAFPEIQALNAMPPAARETSKR